MESNSVTSPPTSDELREHRKLLANLHRALKKADAASATRAPVPTFACEKCHHLKRTSRADPNAWNEIITYLSGGLLYGHEVQRPSWFPKPKRIDRMKPAEAVSDPPSPVTQSPPPDAPIQNPQSKIQNRKLPYTPRPNRAPSQRRPQIEQMLLAGQTFKQIAADLGLVYGTILWHAQQIYKQHGVRTLPELLRKHGHDVPPPPTKEVRRRLLAGQSISQIAAELGCGKTIIYNQRQLLRKKGITLPPTRRSGTIPSCPPSRT